jgi:uncharacterized protein (TIGR03435 family)
VEVADPSDLCLASHREGAGIQMTLVPRRHLACAGFFLTASVAAQQTKIQEAPNFEVVSIRRVPPNAPRTLRSQDFTPVLPGGRYMDSRTTLLSMIAFAYKVTNASQQLLGLPGWAKNQSFAVAAKPAQDFPLLSPAENKEQVCLMMRKMLTERFHLRLHTETRRERIFGLKVAKGGIKITEVDPPVPPAKEGHVNMALSDRGGRMSANKATIAGLARVLALFLQRPVVDQTGLRGYYDLNVQWSAPEAMGGQSHGGLGAEGIGLLISTVQNQLGLHLTKAKGPVEYWVVDHIEPPTEN